MCLPVNLGDVNAVQLTDYLTIDNRNYQLSVLLLLSSAMTFFQGKRNETFPEREMKVRTFSWTFFTIHELQKSCVSIPEKLSDVVSSYQARTSEFPQEEFLRRGALSW